MLYNFIQWSYYNMRVNSVKYINIVKYRLNFELCKNMRQQISYFTTWLLMSETNIIAYSEISRTSEILATDNTPMLQVTSPEFITTIITALYYRYYYTIVVGGDDGSVSRGAVGRRIVNIGMRGARLGHVVSSRGVSQQLS